MSAGNDGQERTEEATPRRKEDARKKGTVAKSNDLIGAALLFVTIGTLPVALSGFGDGIRIGLQNLARAPFSSDPQMIQRTATQIAQPMIAGILFFFGALMIGGLVMNVAQVGFRLTPELLQPDLNKLNPLQGLQRILSRRAAFEGFKAVAKATLFGFIAYRAVASQWDGIIGLAWLAPPAALAKIGTLLLTIAKEVGMAWLTLAALDYLFQRKQVDRQIKMTKDELKREMKEQEGSPELKGERMRRARRLSQGRGLKMVKEADVIITNPTHYAIAVKYDRSEMYAPMVVAKGVDHMAFKIRELAKEAKVPLVENPPLARALYKQCEIGDFVPRDLFQAVAEVLAYVYKSLQNLR